MYKIFAGLSQRREARPPSSFLPVRRCTERTTTTTDRAEEGVVVGVGVESASARPHTKDTQGCLPDGTGTTRALIRGAVVVGFGV